MRLTPCFRTFRLAALPLISLLLVGAGCQPRPTTRDVPANESARFSRVTDLAGLGFRHTDGESGNKYFPEVMGAGCAFADFTGDGLPDIYLVNGGRLTGKAGSSPDRDRFYRNDGNGKFSDLTDAAGLGDPGYGMGCCAGDFDNDGNLDLYVTNLGRNTLYRNRGDGTFEDVTQTAGVGTGGFSTGAAFSDYDGDGDLDLYVCRYVQWSVEKDVACTAPDGDRKVRVYCRPSVYPAAADVLYRNNGDGTFTDVTANSGLAVKPGRGLGCIWSDVNEDGHPDLFVANDMSANFLFINQGDGTFSEEALRRGVALGEGARPFASMGVAATDFDGDGHIDLACTNFSSEYLALYRNLGGGIFEDASARTGLVEATAPYVGFGVTFPDLDLDGYPDLFVVNGHVTEAAEYFYPNIKFAQPSLCLLNDHQGGIAPDTAAGPQLAVPRVSRGAAAADYDGDGDLDVLVANWRGEPDLFRNDGPTSGHWLRLKLAGRRSNRMGIGARVEVTTGGRTQVQELRSGSSYCSQEELILTFGLGSHKTVDSVKVHWPGGKVDRWSKLETDRILRLEQR